MKAKVVNGKVEFLLKAGTHLVRNSSTDLKAVQTIIDNGNIEASDVAGYDIKVKSRVGNEVFYFKVEKPKRKVRKNEESIQ